MANLVLSFILYTRPASRWASTPRPRTPWQFELPERTCRSFSPTSYIEKEIYEKFGYVNRSAASKKVSSIKCAFHTYHWNSLWYILRKILNGFPAFAIIITKFLYFT